MDSARNISISAAIFVLICFLLPWTELSCMGLKESESGLDLARGGERFLWLVPLLMLAIIVFGLTRFIWERAPAIFALVAMVGGAMSAYLMHREYSRIEESEILVAAQWTVWFWLGFAASIGIAVAAFTFYARRARAP